MDDVELTVGVRDWTFDEDIRRWVHVTGPLAGLTQEIVDGPGLTTEIDGGGYYAKPNETAALPAGTFVSLPFLYFERGSDVIAGMFDVEVTAPRLRLLARPPFEAAPEKAHRIRARIATTASTDTIAPMASLDTVAAIARPYIPMVLGMLRKWLAGRR